MKVVFVRHTSVDVPKGSCYGFTDVPLRESFPREAEQTKKNLEKFGTFDAVYSSPLTRAKRLASYCGYDKPIFDDRLKEMNMGDYEMRLYSEISDNGWTEEDWFRDYIHFKAKNGESVEQVYARVSEFLDELKKKEFEQVAVFSHGGILLCAGIYGKLFNAKEAYDHLADYGQIQVVEI